MFNSGLLFCAHPEVRPQAMPTTREMDCFFFLHGLGKQREKKDQMSAALRWNTSSTFMGPSTFHVLTMCQCFWPPLPQPLKKKQVEQRKQLVTSCQKIVFSCILGEFIMYLNLRNRIIARMLYHKGSSHDRTRAFEVSARPLSVALA